MAVAVSTSGGGPAVKATPSLRMFLSIGMAMVGAMMFGLDQGNFGNVATFKSFRMEWCLDRYGNATTCYLDEKAIDKNKAWVDGPVLWGATLITIGAAVGALILAPWIAKKKRPPPLHCCGRWHHLSWLPHGFILVLSN